MEVVDSLVDPFLAPTVTSIGLVGHSLEPVEWWSIYVVIGVCSYMYVITCIWYFAPVVTVLVVLYNPKSIVEKPCVHLKTIKRLLPCSCVETIPHRLPVYWISNIIAHHTYQYIHINFIHITI